MSKVGQKVLSDEFAISGNDYTQFKKAIAAMDEMTHEVVVKGGEIDFYSICEVEKLQGKDKLIFYDLKQDNITSFVQCGGYLHAAAMPEKQLGSKLANELKKTTGLMVIIHGEKYIISDIAIPTLTTRAAVTGLSTINRQNFIRNLHLIDGIYSRNEEIHFVFREADIGQTEEGAPIHVKKIFAALGNMFTMIPQRILTDVVDMIAAEGVLGRVDVYNWSIDQKYTDIYIDFPDACADFKSMYKLKDDIIPGILLCTSDVGYSSVIVRGVYRIGNSYIITDEVMMKHIYTTTIDKIMEKVESDIFTNIRKLPETLAALIGMDVTDYSAIDLTTPDGAAANYRAVSECITKTAKKLLKDVLPVKRQKPLIACMCDEINSSIHYTLYDIAVNFISIPNRIEGLDSVSLTEVRKACAQAPYLLYGKKSKEEAKEDITLLPS